MNTVLSKFHIQNGATRTEMRTLNPSDLGKALELVGSDDVCTIQHPLIAKVMLGTVRLNFPEVGMLSLNFIDDKLVIARILIGTAHLPQSQIIGQLKNIESSFAGDDWVALTPIPATTAEIMENIQALDNSGLFDRQIGIWKHYESGVTTVLKMLIIGQDLTGAEAPRYRLRLTFEMD